MNKKNFKEIIADERDRLTGVIPYDPDMNHLPEDVRLEVLNAFEKAARQQEFIDEIWPVLKSLIEESETAERPIWSYPLDLPESLIWNAIDRAEFDVHGAVSIWQSIYSSFGDEAEKNDDKSTPRGLFLLAQSQMWNISSSYFKCKYEEEFNGLDLPEKVHQARLEFHRWEGIGTPETGPLWVQFLSRGLAPILEDAERRLTLERDLSETREKLRPVKSSVDDPDKQSKDTKPDSGPSELFTVQRVLAIRYWLKYHRAATLNQLLSPNFYRSLIMARIIRICTTRHGMKPFTSTEMARTPK